MGHGLLWAVVRVEQARRSYGTVGCAWPKGGVTLRFADLSKIKCTKIPWAAPIRFHQSHPSPCILMAGDGQDGHGQGQTRASRVVGNCAGRSE